MQNRTVLAKLPPMQKQDYEEFEKTVPIWGEQRAIRRKQLYLQVYAAIAAAGIGMAIAKMRRNTGLYLGIGALLFALAIRFLCFRSDTVYSFPPFPTAWVIGFATLPFVFGGSAAGHVIAQHVYPSVADNKETRFVRRMWWAQKCIGGK